MGKREKQAAAKTPAASLVQAGGKAEKRLLRREHRAEQALSSARARLQKAQDRLVRRLSAVADAEAILRGRQQARALGPAGGPAGSSDGMIELTTTPETSTNGAEVDIITGPDVAAELAAIETGKTATTAAPAKRPSRAKPAAKAAKEPAPAAARAEFAVPAAAKPAPKRSRPSRAAKATEGSS